MKTDTSFYFRLSPVEGVRATVDMIQSQNVHFIRRAIKVIREMNKRMGIIRPVDKD